MMNEKRMGLASAMVGAKPAKKGGGIILEDEKHESEQEGKMDEILRTVKTIEEKLGSLMNEEMAEKVEDENGEENEGEARNAGYK